MTQVPKDIDLETKIAHLSRAETYREGPAQIEVVQTHMSCVFLTPRHAYKLKKPVRHSFLDFSTLAARRYFCDEELRLNRRLAPEVYLAVVALTREQDGQLALDGQGTVVDWLVKMRRLPAALLLDHALAAHSVNKADVQRFAAVLSRFYRDAARLELAPEAYLQRYQQGIEENHEVLAEPRYGMPLEDVRRASAAQRAFIRDNASLLTQRVHERRIVEGHGDLRPEHVCLTPIPIFIDCLEFNPAYRVMDPADELAYLALECELLDAPFVGEVAYATYCDIAHDVLSPPLVAFYKAFRATVRAKLCVWHLDDPDAHARAHWVNRGRRYLELALRYMSR